VLVDPRRRLAEDEPAVSAGRAGSDAAPLDDRDGGAGVGEEARDRAAGQPRAGDDDLSAVIQVSKVSPPLRRLRQKKSTPANAAMPAAMPVFGERGALFAFAFTVRFAIGFAIV
jgi:hypothetical protein